MIGNPHIIINRNEPEEILVFSNIHSKLTLKEATYLIHYLKSIGDAAGAIIVDSLIRLTIESLKNNKYSDEEIATLIHKYNMP